MLYHRIIISIDIADFSTERIHFFFIALHTIQFGIWKIRLHFLDDKSALWWGIVRIVGWIFDWRKGTFSFYFFAIHAPNKYKLLLKT